MIRIHLKTISLICKNCNNPFEKESKEYNRKLKQNPDCSFFCSKQCGYKQKCGDDYSPFRVFFSTTKKNSQHKKLSFDLDLVFLKNLWETQEGKCKITSIPMILSPSRYRKVFKPDSASIDRIDPTEGYIKGNVQFVCLSINYARNRFNDKDFLVFLNKIRKK